MAGSVLKIDIRRGKILEKLKSEGAVSVSQLAQELGTTPVTIRSDLAALEKDDCLLRIQGGALLKSQPQERSISSFEKTSVPNLESKLSIAKAVAKNIHDGDTLFINSGSTMELVASALRGHKNLHIVTNAMNVAMELVKIPTFRVILLGGEINAQYAFSYGSDAQTQLRHYQANWALLTLDGISVEGGLTTFNAEEATINCMMASQSRQVLIAADHSKVGKAGFFRFGDASQGVHLVTDSLADHSTIENLRANGIKVQISEY